MGEPVGLHRAVKQPTLRRVRQVVSALAPVPKDPRERRGEPVLGLSAEDQLREALKLRFGDPLLTNWPHCH